MCLNHGAREAFLVRLDACGHAGAARPADVARERGHKGLADWVRKELYRREQMRLPYYELPDRQRRPSLLCPHQVPVVMTWHIRTSSLNH